MVADTNICTVIGTDIDTAGKNIHQCTVDFETGVLPTQSRAHTKTMRTNDTAANTHAHAHTDTHTHDNHTIATPMTNNCNGANTTNRTNTNISIRLVQLTISPTIRLLTMIIQLMRLLPRDDAKPIHKTRNMPT